MRPTGMHLAYAGYRMQGFNIEQKVGKEDLCTHRRPAPGGGTCGML